MALPPDSSRCRWGWPRPIPVSPAPRPASLPPSRTNSSSSSSAMSSDSPIVTSLSGALLAAGFPAVAFPSRRLGLAFERNIRTQIEIAAFKVQIARAGTAAVQPHVGAAQHVVRTASHQIDFTARVVGYQTNIGLGIQIEPEIAGGSRFRWSFAGTLRGSARRAFGASQLEIAALAAATKAGICRRANRRGRIVVVLLLQIQVEIRGSSRVRRFQVQIEIGLCLRFATRRDPPLVGDPVQFVRLEFPGRAIADTAESRR